MSKIILFMDLDDTIFQTKRKKDNGLVQATYPTNPENISYMTNAQNLLLNLFLKSEDVKIVPVTARDMAQYNRTEISKNEKILAASTYFAGMIHEGNEIDLEWKSHIDNSYKNLEIKMEEVFNEVKESLDHLTFNLTMNEHYYLVIKNKNKNSQEYIEQNNNLKKTLEKDLKKEYFIHHNDNNISIIPKFIDKKNAVEYMINKYKPELTIGAGDSITDLGFMHLCDYKLIPTNSQIDKISLKDFI